MELEEKFGLTQVYYLKLLTLSLLITENKNTSDQDDGPTYKNVYY